MFFQYAKTGHCSMILTPTHLFTYPITQPYMQKQTKIIGEGIPYLVIAKEQYPEGTASSSPPPAHHFFTFASDEGSALNQVRAFLRIQYEQEQRRYHSVSNNGEQFPGLVAYPAYQFTVKYAPESQGTPGSRVFSL